MNLFFLSLCLSLLYRPHGKYDIAYLSWASAKSSGRKQNRTWSTLRECQQSVLSYLASAPDFWVWVCPEHLWSNSAAYVPTSDVFVRGCLNGVSRYYQIVSEVALNRRLTLSSHSVKHKGKLRDYLV